MELATKIREIFISLGYKWSFKDRNHSGPALDTPTLDEVVSFLDNAVDMLDDSAGSWMESGQILIKNDYGHDKDVYVRIGTINKENNND